MASNILYTMCYKEQEGGREVESERATEREKKGRPLKLTIFLCAKEYISQGKVFNSYITVRSY